LIIVQNLSVPFDRRVWMEATTLRQMGADVFVVCPKGKKIDLEKHAKIEGIHIYRYSSFQASRNLAAFLVEFAYCWIMTFILSWKVYFKHGFDVIHACNPPETYFLMALLFKLLGVRFVFDHHDLSPEMYLAKYKKEKDFVFKVLLFLEKCTFRTADCVITTNHSHREVAVNRGKVPVDKIFIVRSGPDLIRFREYPPDESFKNGKKHLVCYLGEMCAQDGVDGLLRSIVYFIRKLERDDAYFIFIGGGPEQPAMVTLSKELEIDEWVHFTGRVSDDALCRILSSADVCVDPDPWNEWSDKSTMNKIMEYMFFQKPIVAFNLKENRFSAGPAAVYAETNTEEEFAEKIACLLDDPEKRRKLGISGRKHFEENLSWEHSVPFLRQAYITAFQIRS